MRVTTTGNRTRQAPVAMAFLALLMTSGLVAQFAYGAEQPTAAPAAERPSPIWDALRPDIFGDREIRPGGDIIRLDAPKRAQDAALVPVEIAVAPGKAIKTVTVIVDVNPAPVAATFGFAADSGVSKLSTRLRVNDYSYIRAIAETESGELYMAYSFVKASGGCSAPAVKNQAEAQKTMGQMKLRQFAEAGAPKELQLMIRHPNNSGLQMDPITRYYIPPHFVQKLTVMRDDKPLMTMEGGISISEDPNFRFDYNPGTASEIRVEAVDTDGLVFKDKWPVERAGL